MPRARRGASASERCRSALWRNVLSIVRKSRYSSSGLYRCRRRSAYDRHRTNAVRFLMKTIVIRPPPRLIHAFRQNLSGCAWALAAVFVSLPKPRSRHPRLLARHNYSSQSFGVGSILLFKAAGCWHAKIRIQNRSLPRLRLIAHGTFPRRSGNVRGRLRPTLE